MYAHVHHKTTLHVVAIVDRKAIGHLGAPQFPCEGSVSVTNTNVQRHLGLVNGRAAKRARRGEKTGERALRESLGPICKSFCWWQGFELGSDFVLFRQSFFLGGLRFIGIFSRFVGSAKAGIPCILARWLCPQNQGKPDLREWSLGISFCQLPSCGILTSHPSGQALILVNQGLRIVAILSEHMGMIMHLTTTHFLMDPLCHMYCLSLCGAITWMQRLSQVCWRQVIADGAWAC